MQSTRKTFQSSSSLTYEPPLKTEVQTVPNICWAHNEDKCPHELSSDSGIHFSLELLSLCN